MMFKYFQYDAFFKSIKRSLNLAKYPTIAEFDAVHLVDAAAIFGPPAVVPSEARVYRALNQPLLT